MAMIDFHTHVLPGVDDGSRNTEMSLEMLRIAASQGVDLMVATPHFYADSDRVEPFLERRRGAYEQLMERREPDMPELVCGAEVAFFWGIGHAEGIERLCIGNTNLMLLEMPFRPWSEKDLLEVQQLIRRGIRPILAHLERFYPYQKDKELIPALVEYPLYVQINAECLLNWKTRHQPLKLFKQGKAHLLGSDCHNLTSRPENLAEGRAVLARKAGKDCLQNLDALGTALLKKERP
jgi:protein-tyrosine phosphatase